MLTKLFEFQGARVRVIMIEGEPWFVASDVAKVLGYRDAEKAIRGKLRPHQIRTHEVGTNRGPRTMTIINEAGVNRLVMRSERPEAEAFQDWIEGDVIPSLARTGTYTMPGANSGAVLPDLTNADEATVLAFAEITNKLAQASARMVAELQGRKAADAKVVALETVVVEKDKKIAELEIEWDMFREIDGLLQVSTVAKLLQQAGIDTSPDRLWDQLIDLKLVMRKKSWRGRNAYEATVKAKGWLVTVGQKRQDKDGNWVAAETSVRFTVLGCQKVQKILYLDQMPKLSLVQGELEFDGGHEASPEPAEPTEPESKLLTDERLEELAAESGLIRFPKVGKK